MTDEDPLFILRDGVVVDRDGRVAIPYHSEQDGDEWLAAWPLGETPDWDIILTRDHKGEFYLFVADYNSASTFEDDDGLIGFRPSDGGGKAILAVIFGPRDHGWRKAEAFPQTVPELLAQIAQWAHTPARVET